MKKKKLFYDMDDNIWPITRLMFKLFTVYLNNE